MRRRNRWTLRPEYLTTQYERLSALPIAQAIACLTHSTANEYQGIFPERFQSQATTKKSGQDVLRELQSHMEGLNNDAG
jgi:hypothetical protein